MAGKPACLIPWAVAASINQPLPWRGRISHIGGPRASGYTGSGRPPRRPKSLRSFGTVATGCTFGVSGRAQLSYSGPNEWSYRRFILHYAKLCATGWRGGRLSASARRLRGLDADPRARLTQLPCRWLPSRQLSCRCPCDARVQATKISYAADWSEYAGYDDGQGNRYFHLDPPYGRIATSTLLASTITCRCRTGAMKFGPCRCRIGELSTILITLKANIAGGEYFDWYYGSDEERDCAEAVRTPIDGWGVWRTMGLAASRISGGWWAERPS